MNKKLILIKKRIKLWKKHKNKLERGTRDKTEHPRARDRYEGGICILRQCISELEDILNPENNTKEQ